MQLTIVLMHFESTMIYLLLVEEFRRTFTANGRKSIANKTESVFIPLYFEMRGITFIVVLL